MTEADDARTWAKTYHKRPDQIGYRLRNFTIIARGDGDEAPGVLSSGAPNFIGPKHGSVGTLKGIVAAHLARAQDQGERE